MRRPAGRTATLALAFALGAAVPVAAQTHTAPPFLIISQERLLTGSRSGQALLAEENTEREAMSREARALDSAFEAEERDLTERRAELPPEEFRSLSDAFDARVVKARRDQDEKAETLAQEFEQKRRAFYGRVAPILVQVMDRAGARAIFDENSILLADQSLNITDAVIAEIDAAASPDPAPETTETPPPPETAPPAAFPLIAPPPPRETPAAAPPAARTGGN